MLWNLGPPKSEMKGLRPSRHREALAVCSLRPTGITRESLRPDPGGTGSDRPWRDGHGYGWERR